MKKKKNIAIFLDRDGTLNKEKNYLTNINKLKLYPNAIKALKYLNNKSPNFLVIVITNQSAVSRGLLDEKMLKKINSKIKKIIKINKGKIDFFYYCKHLPIDNCKCRKPKIGMIEEAKKKFNIDLSKSWLIGDSTTDIETGKNSNLKTILLKTGFAGKDKKYNIISKLKKNHLFDAIKYILKSDV